MRKITSMLVSITLFMASLTTSFTNINITNVQADIVDWPGAPAINGEAACLIEASTGTILYEKKAHSKMYPASITKILTALVTLENCNLGDEVTFSEEAVLSLEAGDANMAMEVGEIMTVEECLYGLMLQSANEVATALAEHTAGSVEAFATMMNESAAAAGATGSNFMNANGLHNDNHYITAYDMALITRAAIANPVFVSISGTQNYTVGATNKKEAQTIYNRHKMLSLYSGYHYEGILGGKTGFTDQSGTTLVTYAKRGDMTLICVVLNSNSYNVYLDTATLFDYGFENFKLVNAAENDTRFSAETDQYTDMLKPVFGSTENPELYIDPTDYIVLPNDGEFADVTSTINYDISSSNVDSGSAAFAHITYTYGEDAVGFADVVYDTDSPSINASAPAKPKPSTDTTSDSSSEDKSIDLSKYIDGSIVTGIIVGLLILILLFATYRYIRKKHRELEQIRARKRRRY